MKTPSGPRLVFWRVIAASAVLALLAAAFAVLGRRDPAVRPDGPGSAPQAAMEEPASKFALPSLPATAGLMSAADRTANRALLTGDSRPSATETQPNPFTLDNAASSGDLPWNGLRTSAAAVGFGNGQISATPAPAAAESFEPVAGGDRTDLPVVDPNP